MNENLNNQILQIYAQTVEKSLTNLWFFEQIPPKKLKNAMKAYVPSFQNDEYAVCLYDDTLLGSGKAGFILTTKRLYCKNILGTNGGIVNVANITAISYKQNSLIISAIGAGDYDIPITQIFGKDSRAAFMEVTDRVIKLLKGEVPVTSAPIAAHTEATAQAPGAPTLEICKNCGAPNDSSRQVCRYCSIKL
jgi:hypothetical protein